VIPARYAAAAGWAGPDGGAPRSISDTPTQPVVTQYITNTFSEKVDRRSRSQVESAMYLATSRANARR